MSGNDEKPIEARSFLPAEIIQVPVVPQPSIAAPASTSRREGVRINLVGEIGPYKPISLSAVKDHVMRREGVPIIININSGGGNIAEAFRIYEWLHALPIPLAVVADTHCCSAAVKAVIFRPLLRHIVCVEVAALRQCKQ